MGKSIIFALLIVLASFGVSAYFYPQIPETVASHWDINGEANGYMSKFWGLFLMPIISLAIFLFFLSIPKIDPLKSNIEKFRKYFDAFIVVFLLFFLYVHLLTVAWNLGTRFNMVQFMSPAFGVLFYFPARIPRGFAPGMNGGETNFSDRVANLFSRTCPPKSASTDEGGVPEYVGALPRRSLLLRGVNGKSKTKLVYRFQNSVDNQQCGGLGQNSSRWRGVV